jgi:hypothetical protein
MIRAWIAKVRLWISTRAAPKGAPHTAERDPLGDLSEQWDPPECFQHEAARDRTPARPFADETDWYDWDDMQRSRYRGRFLE